MPLQTIQKYDMSKMSPVKVCAIFFKRYKWGQYYSNFTKYVTNHKYSTLLDQRLLGSVFTTSMSTLVNTLGLCNARNITAEYYNFIKNNFINLSDEEIEKINKCVKNFPLLK